MDKIKHFQKKGLNRNIIDKFYTKSYIVKKCIKYIKKYLEIDKNNDLIIEPSAGNGAFIEEIKLLSNNYKFYDIQPDKDDIIKQDFLNIDYKKLKEKYTNIHIIGNPPFGRQSSLAIQFIKISCQFANSISFILPKSFKKNSMQKYFLLNYHLIFEIDLPKNSFIINNQETDVPCIFQIWFYKNKKRKIINKLIPINFEFVKKNDNPDISFRRVGVNAGKIMQEIENKSIQSHYFIKFTNNLSIEQNINKLKIIKFNTNNTVGPKSISKQELIKEFNKILNNHDKIINDKININYINERILNEICFETINKLSDLYLLDKYKKCISVKNKINRLDKILKKYDIENDKKEKIINDYLLELIPAGTKGIIRGNKFNNIIKKNIIKMNLDENRFQICFEKNFPDINTDEKPDWYIYDKIKKKVLIGMNQLDLWNGGQQLNRGYKYLINNNINTKNSKLLCVICNKIKFDNDNNKIYKLFEIGFTNDTLCYLKNLPNIIKNYFNL